MKDVKDLYEFFFYRGEEIKCVRSPRIDGLLNADFE